MSVGITYAGRHAWLGSGTNFSNRPYTFLRVAGPAGYMDLWALVDTGADYLMLDASVATATGLNLASASRIYVTVAGGGTVAVHKLAGVPITVEGRSGHVEALFGTVTTPLLGRTAILGVIDFGIDGSGWLYG